MTNWHQTPLVIPDTVGKCLECHNFVLAPLGQSLSWVQLMALMGHSAMDMCQSICRDFHLRITPEEYKRRVGLVYSEVFPKSTAMPGTLHLAPSVPLMVLSESVSSASVLQSLLIEANFCNSMISMKEEALISSWWRGTSCTYVLWFVHCILFLLLWGQGVWLKKRQMLYIYVICTYDVHVPVWPSKTISIYSCLCYRSLCSLILFFFSCHTVLIQ